MDDKTFTDFVKIVFVSLIGILNVWLVHVVTGIRDDVREVRKWFVDHLAGNPHPERRKTQAPHEREEAAERAS